jgi:hypothetical protein
MRVKKSHYQLLEFMCKFKLIEVYYILVTIFIIVLKL